MYKKLAAEPDTLIGIIKKRNLLQRKLFLKLFMMINPTHQTPSKKEGLRNRSQMNTKCKYFPEKISFKGLFHVTLIL